MGENKNDSWTSINDVDSNEFNSISKLLSFWKVHLTSFVECALLEFSFGNTFCCSKALEPATIHCWCKFLLALKFIVYHCHKWYDKVIKTFAVMFSCFVLRNFFFFSPKNEKCLFHYFMSCVWFRFPVDHKIYFG